MRFDQRIGAPFYHFRPKEIESLFSLSRIVPEQISKARLPVLQCVSALVELRGRSSATWPPETAGMLFAGPCSHGCLLSAGLPERRIVALALADHREAGRTLRLTDRVRKTANGYVVPAFPGCARYRSQNRTRSTQPARCRQPNRRDRAQSPRFAGP